MLGRAKSGTAGAHHVGQLLDVLGEERKKALFGKLFRRIVSSRIIIKDVVGIEVDGRQIGFDVVSVYAFLLVIIITIAAASATLTK